MKYCVGVYLINETNTTLRPDQHLKSFLLIRCIRGRCFQPEMIYISVNYIQLCEEKLTKCCYQPRKIISLTMVGEFCFKFKQIWLPDNFTSPQHHLNKIFSLLIKKRFLILQYERMETLLFLSFFKVQSMSSGLTKVSFF